VLKFIHLIERTELVSEETSVTILYSSKKSRNRGKMIQGQIERERVRERWRENKTVNARRMLGTSSRLRYVFSDSQRYNCIKLFKFNC
jgi:hypothetical protein